MFLSNCSNILIACCRPSQLWMENSYTFISSTRSSFRFSKEVTCPTTSIEENTQERHKPERCDRTSQDSQRLFISEWTVLHSWYSKPLKRATQKTRFSVLLTDDDATCKNGYGEAGQQILVEGHRSCPGRAQCLPRNALPGQAYAAIYGTAAD